MTYFLIIFKRQNEKLVCILTSLSIFLAHAENRLCGIRVLFPLSIRCQLPSYNTVGSHFNHRLTVVNSIKRAAHIKNCMV